MILPVVSNQKWFAKSTCSSTRLHPLNSTWFQYWFQHDFTGWIQPKMVCKNYMFFNQISPIEFNLISLFWIQPDFKVACVLDKLVLFWSRDFLFLKYSCNNDCTKVKRTGVLNYKTACVEVNTSLHLDTWYYILKEYHDPQLFDYLRFGFPLSVNIMTRFNIILRLLIMLLQLISLKMWTFEAQCPCRAV